MFFANRKYLTVVIFSAIIFLALLLRFYKLGQIPNGLYQDETAIGYNAYSILQTGKDEYGKFMPLYFKSFGDYKLPVYIYLDVIPIKIFGLSEFAVRFPSALFSFLTVIVAYFLVKELSGKRSLAILTTLFVAMNPWHLFYSRATYEVSIALFLFCLGALLLHKALENSRHGLFWLGTSCFILAVYTYNLTRFLSPILYLLMLFFERRRMVRISRKELALTISTIFLLLLPLGLTFFDKAGVTSAKGTLIFTSSAVLAPLLEFRSYLIDLPGLLTKILFNNYLLLFWRYLQNATSYLSVVFFFLTGDSHGNHGIGNMGQFYLFELLLIPLGIYEVFRRKLRYGYLLVIWSVAIVLVASLTRETPQATRSFFLIFPMEFFSALGLLTLIARIKKIQDVRLKKIIIISFSLICFYNIVYYFASYYGRFPVAYAKSWHSVDKETVLYIKSREKDYDQVVIDENSGLIYSSLLFYQKFSPFEFQKTVQRAPDDNEGFSQVFSFDKFIYRKIDWEKDLGKFPKKLLITSPNDLPRGRSALATFFYPKKPVVLSIKEQIFQYPEEETGYVVYESD